MLCGLRIQETNLYAAGQLQNPVITDPTTELTHNGLENPFRRAGRSSSVEDPRPSPFVTPGVSTCSSKSSPFWKTVSSSVLKSTTLALFVVEKEKKGLEATNDLFNGPRELNIYRYRLHLLLIIQQ